MQKKQHNTKRAENDLFTIKMPLALENQIIATLFYTFHLYTALDAMLHKNYLTWNRFQCI